MGSTVAKPPKIDIPQPKDKNICENKNNNIYKETISKLDTPLNHDNQEEKPPNEKKNKKHSKESKISKHPKKPKEQKDPKDLPSLSTSHNTNE